MPKTTLPAFTPVPRLKDRSNGWKPEVQRRFIEALAETGSVEAAAKRVGRSSNGAYQLRRHPQAKEFRKAWQAALDLGVQRIEDVAMDRALNGVEVPVYAYGKIIGQRTVYNDRLLMFMLRNRAPKRFAADGARGLSGLDKQRVARLKKQWEEERNSTSPADVRASIARKVEKIRQEIEATMSPETRKLKAAYEQSYRRDTAQPDWWKEKEEERGSRGADGAAVEDAEWEECGEAAEEEQHLPGGRSEEPEQDDGPRVRNLKDNDWR